VYTGRRSGILAGEKLVIVVAGAEGVAGTVVGSCGAGGAGGVDAVSCVVQCCS